MKKIILSFDIEEWPLYGPRNMGDTRNLDVLLNSFMELLDSKHIKATCFCLGELAEKYPNIVKTIADAGHDIGCHSYAHKWLTTFTEKEFYEDTKRALSAIEGVIGRKVKYYRAPAFSIGKNNLWTIPILSELGIEIDCSIFPASRSFGGFPGFEQDTPTWISHNGVRMKEMPMSIESVLGKKLAYSGGGYFRLLPYPMIKNFFNRNDYVMTYFHMRDFDTKQNRKISLRYIKNYYGINVAWNKFLKLIDDFDMTNVSTADSFIDWDACPTISV